MTRPMPGGRRRVDLVLAPEFLADLGELSLSDLRARRHEAEQEEVDLSFLRRMLHGRIDLVTAELGRREPDSTAGAVVDDLSAILADDERSTFGLGRHVTLEPSRVDEQRRAEEQAAADAVTADVEGRTDEELRAALIRLRAHEAEISDVRRSVQKIMDALSAELTARYRNGSASVDELLATDTGA